MAQRPHLSGVILQWRNTNLEKLAGAMVGGVDGDLLRADVVRPDGGAGTCLAPWVTRPLPAKKSTKVGKMVFMSSFEQV
jgi:hypothetical protein